MGKLQGNEFKNKLLNSAIRFGIIQENRIDEMAVSNAVVGEKFWERSPSAVQGANTIYIPAGKRTRDWRDANFDRVFSYQTIILQRNYLDKTYGINRREYQSEDALHNKLISMGVDEQLIPFLISKGEVTIGNTTRYSVSTGQQQSKMEVYKADVKVNGLRRGIIELLPKNATIEELPPPQEPAPAFDLMRGEITEELSKVDLEPIQNPQTKQISIHVDFLDENGNVLKSLENEVGESTLTQLLSKIKTPGQLPRNMQSSIRTSGVFPFNINQNYKLKDIAVKNIIEFKWNNAKKQFIYNKSGWPKREVARQQFLK